MVLSSISAEEEEGEEEEEEEVEEEVKEEEEEEEEEESTKKRKTSWACCAHFRHSPCFPSFFSFLFFFKMSCGDDQGEGGRKPRMWTEEEGKGRWVPGRKTHSFIR